MKQLTKAEEEVMQILWELKEGVVKDLVNGFKEKQPAYNTVATVLKVLKNKEIVDFRKVGNIYVYYPLISKEEYSSYQMKYLMKNYFGDSFTRFAAFFAKDNNMSLEDLEGLLKETETNK